MTKEELEHLRMALAIQGIEVPIDILDQILMTKSKILRKGGDYNLKDAVETVKTIKEKYNNDKSRETSTSTRT